MADLPPSSQRVTVGNPPTCPSPGDEQARHDGESAMTDADKRREPTTTSRPPCTVAVSMAIFETNTGTTAAVISGFQSLGVVFGGGTFPLAVGRGQ